MLVSLLSFFGIRRRSYSNVGHIPTFWLLFYRSICIYICTFIHAYICMHTYTYMYIYTWCMCVCAKVCTRKISAYVYMYTNTNTYVCIRTYIHTYHTYLHAALHTTDAAPGHVSYLHYIDIDSSGVDLHSISCAALAHFLKTATMLKGTGA